MRRNRQPPGKTLARNLYRYPAIARTSIVTWITAASFIPARLESRNTKRSADLRPVQKNPSFAIFFGFDLTHRQRSCMQIHCDLLADTDCFTVNILMRTRRCRIGVPITFCITCCFWFFIHFCTSWRQRLFQGDVQHLIDPPNWTNT